MDLDERQKLLAITVLVFAGAGVLVFYAVRDGFIRRHTKINAIPEPLTGNRAVAIGIVWMIVAAAFLATGIWVVRYALSLPPG
ncbi:MAG: hypothetical protein ABL977_03140 [Candidatus Eisenbacteria bacterium]